MTAGRKCITKNKEWYTPSFFMEHVYAVMGEVSLDPCAATESAVKAVTKFILPTDGLVEQWEGYKTIFVNPPYGRDKIRGTSIKDWLRKCHNSAQAGSEVIALIPVAPNTSHWKEFVFPSCDCICFLKEPRFKFEGAGKKGAPMAICAVYWGKRKNKFAEVFKIIGSCMEVVN